MKLFIGNLSYDTTEPELREIFEPFEPILELRRPTDRDTGRPRGFAFVTLEDDEKGNQAIDALNGKSLGGNQLRVNEAEEREPRFNPSHRPGAPSNDVTEGTAGRTDNRPTDSDGKKVVYKSI